MNCGRHAGSWGLVVGRFPVVLLVFVVVFTSTLVMADERPNIVLLVADDLGYSHVGFNGCKVRRSLVP